MFFDCFLDVALLGCYMVFGFCVGVFGVFSYMNLGWGKSKGVLYSTCYIALNNNINNNINKNNNIKQKGEQE